MMKKDKNEEGIILLEAIIAVAVLATMFAAAMALFATAVVGVRISADQLVATYLAQDGMEQVVGKNQYNKDNFLEPWFTGLEQCVNQSCEVHYFETDFTTPATSCSNCTLYHDTASGIYSTDSSVGPASHFSREIYIDYTAGNHEAFISVTVSWPDGPATMSYTLNHTIYDHVPKLF